ncbi:tripartite tricarboxylate transporter substrate binding protein [Roseomonas terrae]|jgi:tripartite-type tricarboxylate transporter receptor subunit TctC|uniref:Tripartite tricarboxylate transporter substrate binding protein n=1 Tax=Neoroseomonas terrae TaxID=424799 RepID=A0ABS5EMY1_9PROT|nr:tripartite tricarboxylate transporter substrate binding protein [Neoroseomonas terrae]MBR0652398.1 tripartite tricarboxylate transporter substrate binding protein [Neoroseomonas terrae]
MAQTRRATLGLMAGMLPGLAAAQSQAPWPNRPIRLVIPWPPGQATDLAGRVIAQRLQEKLGQPVVPENRAGAGGTIGADVVAKAAPDGYTLLAGSSGPLTIAPLLQRLPFDVTRDIAPIAMMGVSPYVLAVKPDFPARTTAEFIALLKARPGHYTFGSSGTAATAHLITEAFNAAAGIEALHVPFPGSAPAMTALIGGQINYCIETMAAVMPLVRQGALRALGISLSAGSTLAPEIEPFAKVGGGLAGFDAGAWLGLMGPANLPAPILERLSNEVVQGMAVPEVRSRFESISVEPIPRATAAFATYLVEQRALFQGIIQRNNIRLE